MLSYFNILYHYSIQGRRHGASDGAGGTRSPLSFSNIWSLTRASPKFKMYTI
jgi:hypothetical protein